MLRALASLATTHSMCRGLRWLSSRALISTRIWTSRRCVFMTTLWCATGTTGMMAHTSTSLLLITRMVRLPRARISSALTRPTMLLWHHTSTPQRFAYRPTAISSHTPASLSQAQSMPFRPTRTSSSTHLPPTRLATSQRRRLQLARISS